MAMDLERLLLLCQKGAYFFCFFLFKVCDCVTMLSKSKFKFSKFCVIVSISVLESINLPLFADKTVIHREYVCLQTCEFQLLVTLFRGQ